MSSSYNNSGATPTKQYFPALTGLRAIAAFMVYFVHFNPFDARQQAGSIGNFTRLFFNHLGIGVTVFFVLSGFLITARYQQGLLLSWPWWQRYIRNRVARIYPLYFLITIITFIASQINTSYDPSRLWRFYQFKEKILVLFLNLTFLRGFFERFAFTLAGQGWSLTVEECFYLLAPFLLLGLQRQAWRLLFYPILLIGIGLLLVAVGSHFYEPLFSFFGSVRFMLDWTFFGRCTEFLLGMALALIMARRPWVLPQGRYPVATFAGIIWIVICIYALMQFDQQAPTHAIGAYSYPAIFTLNVVLPIGVVLVLWGLIKERSWLRSLLERPLFELLGRASYAFYLIHVGVLSFALDYFVTRNIYLKFVIINLVAVALYKLVEHPAHLLITRRKGLFSASPPIPHATSNS